MLDLIVINSASLVLAVIIAAGGPQPLRVILGLPFVLFFPGYCLIAALFPKKDDLDSIERVALSFGLSIAVVPLIGLALNYTPWGIRLNPILISLLTFIALMSGLTFYRRRRLPEEERFRPAIALPRVDWQGMSRLDKVLSMVLAGAIIFAVASIVYVVSTPKVGERFTEFYILGPGGKAEGYPRELALGESGRVILGIVNHEYAVVTYRAEVRCGGRVLVTLGPLKLSHEEKYEGELAFTPASPGEKQKVEFLLYKLAEERQPGLPDPRRFPKQPSAGEAAEGPEAPYRSLHLWVDVKPPGPAAGSPAAP
ncbi:MAG: hypothetical protein PWP65_1860 [Clostridia bacterium]|nr:hypothetical protein [Clostridia bacterium]